MDSDIGTSGKSGQQATVKRVLMSRLIDAVKQCQTTFGATKTIAAESHTSVAYLLSQLEAVLYHGLKKNPSMLNTIKDMAEWVTTIKLDNFLASGSPGDALWACLRTLLSESELQRLHNLKHVTTDAGRARAWVRIALNERSIRRYLEQLAGDKPLLEMFYEERAFLRDAEASAVFPQVCSGLDTILFSLEVDNRELDLQSHLLDDEAFEALLEAKKAPQPIMAVRSDSRNRLDSTGSGTGTGGSGSHTGGLARKRRPLVNVVSFDNDRKLAGSEGHMKVLATGTNGGGGTGKGKTMTRSVSESEKKALVASSISPEDLKRLTANGLDDSSRPSSADVLGSVSSVSESVFTTDDRTGSRAGDSPPSMLYVQLSSGTISQVCGMKDISMNRGGLSDDSHSEATTRSRRSSLAEDDRHQSEELVARSKAAGRSGISLDGASDSYMKDRILKQQEIIEQLRYDLRTLRDEHLQFVRHQSARLDLVMKEQETVRDLWRRKLMAPMLTPAVSLASAAGGEPIGDSLYEKKLIQLTQMHGELLELNESLQKQLQTKTAIGRRMKDELIALRGPLPEDFATEVNSGSSNVNVNLWVPTAFLTGKGTDVHHVYQVYIRLKYSEWNVYRRYADFHGMHKELVKKDPAISQFRLPPKRKFGHKEKAFVEERRKQLESYLRLMVNYVVRNFPEFQAVSVNKETVGQLIPFFRE